MSRRLLTKRRYNYLGTVHDGVADLAALRAIASTDVLDRCIILVEDEEALYYFDYSSSALDDGTNVIEPDAGPGRWNKLSGTLGVHQGDLSDFDGVTSGTSSSKTFNSTFSGERAGGAADYAGMVTETPYNWVHLRTSPGNLVIADASGHLVYGRLTIAGTALAGTLAFTNGSTAVVGTGTSFLAAVSVGQLVKANAHDESAWAEVAAVVDDTHITLVDAYEGATVSGAASKKGDWTVSYYTKVDGVESAYTFTSNTTMDMRAVQAFLVEDLPFVSLVLEPGELESSSSSGGGSWDEIDSFVGDGVTDTFTLAYANVDKSILGHLTTADGVILEYTDDYTISDETGAGGEDELVFVVAPVLGVKIAIRYNRV